MEQPEFFSRAGLDAVGFLGFTPFGNFRAADVPTVPGVYAVLRPTDRTVEFLSESPAGRFKGKDPTAKVELLQSKWIDDAAVIYVGKAQNLRRRLAQYWQHGSGKPVGHWGGRYIWQLRNSLELIVAWKPHDDPKAEETKLIDRKSVV